MSKPSKVLVSTSKFNQSNICRVTAEGQYYIHMGTTISGARILGFQEVDGAINVLGMNAKKYYNISTSETKNEGDKDRALKEAVKTIAQISTSAIKTIDWYDDDVEVES